MKWKHSLLPVLALGLGLAPLSAQALGPSVIALRSGMIMGSVSGGDNLTGSVTTIPYLDVEYGIFLQSRTSLVFRGVIAIDLADSKVNLAYFGSGQRYYLGSSATGYTRSEGGSSVSINPKLNYFVGWDAGISHMVIGKVGQLAITSTAFDAGPTAGLNYYLFDNVSLNMGVSGSYVLGFSSIAVTGLVIKFYAGVAF